MALCTRELLSSSACSFNTKATMQTIASNTLTARPVAGLRSCVAPRPSLHHHNGVRQQQHQQRANVVLKAAELSAAEIRDIENMELAPDAAAGSSAMLPSGNVKVLLRMIARPLQHDKQLDSPQATNAQQLAVSCGGCVVNCWYHQQQLLSADLLGATIVVSPAAVASEDAWLRHRHPGQGM